MPMLAERKRKTKWTLNPGRQPLWNQDSVGVTFGRGLMEKMGWRVGQGLGINKQGIKEPLKVSFKDDSKGMGFKGNENDWSQQQEDFNQLLSELSSTDNKNNEEICDSKKTLKSLEEKSRLSKARVHYHKFTRGKDLSRYSEKDLECILGRNKRNNEDKNVSNSDEKTGLTISCGSMADYFAQKMKNKRKGVNSECLLIGQEYTGEDYTKSKQENELGKPPRFKDIETEEQKKRKWAEEEECKMSTAENLFSENCEKLISGKKLDSQESVSYGKKKIKSDNRENEENQIFINGDYDGRSCEPFVPDEDVSCETAQCLKKKKRRRLEVESKVSQTEDLVIENSEQLVIESVPASETKLPCDKKNKKKKEKEVKGEGKVLSAQNLEAENCEELVPTEDSNPGTGHYYEKKMREKKSKEQSDVTMSSKGWSSEGHQQLGVDNVLVDEIDFSTVENRKKKKVKEKEKLEENALHADRTSDEDFKKLVTIESTTAETESSSVSRKNKRKRREEEGTMISDSIGDCEDAGNFGPTDARTPSSLGKKKKKVGDVEKKSNESVGGEFEQSVVENFSESEPQIFFQEKEKKKKKKNKMEMTPEDALTGKNNINSFTEVKVVNICKQKESDRLSKYGATCVCSEDEEHLFKRKKKKRKNKECEELNNENFELRAGEENTEKRKKKKKKNEGLNSAGYCTVTVTTSTENDQNATSFDLVDSGNEMQVLSSTDSRSKKRKSKTRETENTSCGACIENSLEIEENDAHSGNNNPHIVKSKTKNVCDIKTHPVTYKDDFLKMQRMSVYKRFNLIRCTNFEKFVGANIKELRGYGFLKLEQKK